MNKLYFFCKLFFSLIILNNYIHSDDQIMTGSLSGGMGGAYSTIARNMETTWNPAALSFNQAISLHSDFSNQYLVPGLNTNYLHLAFPILSRLSFGAEWLNLASSDAGLEYNRNRIGIGTGIKIVESFRIGGTLKYFNASTQYANVFAKSIESYGYDLAAVYQPKPYLRFSSVWRNIGGSYGKYNQSNTKIKLINETHCFGFAFIPGMKLNLNHFKIKNWETAIEIGQKLHIGTQLNLNDYLTLRTGFEQDWRQPIENRYHFGFSINHFVQIHYAFIKEPFLNNTHIFGLSAALMLNPDCVQIKNFRISGGEGVSHSDFFLSQLNSYSHLGHVSLLSEYNNPITVRLSITKKNSNNPLFTEEYELIKNQEKQIIIPMNTDFFNQISSNMAGDAPIELQANIQYAINPLWQEKKKKNTTAKIYKKGRIRWDSPQKIAAYIHPESHAVQSFTTQLLLKNYRTLAINTNSHPYFQLFMVFETLKNLNIRYKPDPITPFSSISTTEDVIDNIYYPFQTFQNQFGDCDDLSALFASVFENLNFETAILEHPGHVFIMVNTEVSSREVSNLQFIKDYFIIYDHSLWIPIEINRINDNFISAWLEGLAEYKQFQEEISIFKTRKAWKNFKPVYYPENPVQFESMTPVELNPTGQFNLELEKILYSVCKDTMPFHSSFDYNRFAINLALMRHNFLAQKILTQAIELYPNHPNSYLNLGIIFVRMDIPERAGEYFQKYSQLNPLNAKGYLYQAIISHQLGQFKKAIKLYQKSKTIPSNIDYQKYDFLEPDFTKPKKNPISTKIITKGNKTNIESLFDWETTK